MSEKIICLRSQIATSRSLRSQFVISSWGDRRDLPYVFIEQGVGILSAIFRSDVTVYHFGAFLKDLGKKWFAFSRMEIGALELLDKVKGLV